MLQGVKNIELLNNWSENLWKQLPDYLLPLFVIGSILCFMFCPVIFLFWWIVKFIVYQVRYKNVAIEIGIDQRKRKK